MYKKQLSIIGLVIISSIPIKAQVSTGFTNPDDFQYLLDYRLPDWGYTNFSIRTGSIGTNGRYSWSREINDNPTISNNENDVSNRIFNLNVIPTFQLYKESEQRVFSLNTFTELSRNTLRYKQESENMSGGMEQSRLNKNNAMRTVLAAENNYYLSSNSFLITNLYSEIQWSKQVQDIDSNGSSTIDEEELNRTIMVRPQIGIGVGRIRNVTPVIRAIRMNERFIALGNESFDRDEILNSAEYFARVQGYQVTKDRFLKSFWGDMNRATNGKLDQVGAFDIFYLNDVFNEILGNRFEGYEAYLSLDYSYMNQLSKENDEIANIENRVSTTSRSASVNLNYDWYKNLDLYHQFALHAKNVWMFPLEESDVYNWMNETAVEAEWLWNFADRFQLNSSLVNSVTLANQKDTSVNKDYIYASRLNSNFYYFIENKVALNVGVSLLYRNDNTDYDTRELSLKNFNWGINAGISYYFNQNLF